MATAEPVVAPVSAAVVSAPAVPTPAVPLSKKSRYVPPHLRADKKDVIVVNPEDEMPPPPLKTRAPPAYPHGAHRSPPMQGGMPMAYPNYPPPHMLPPGPPPPMANGGSGSPMLAPSSPPRKPYAPRSQHSPKQIKEDWRNSARVQQPELNPDDLLPPTKQKIPENSARHMANHPARRYDSRRGGGGAGPPRYYGPGPMGPPPPHGHYGPPPDMHLMDEEDMDPNQLMFAKIESQERAEAQGQGGGALDFDDDNPYRKSPFNGPGPGPGPAQLDWAELNEQDHMHHPPPPQHHHPRHSQRRGPPPGPPGPPHAEAHRQRPPRGQQQGYHVKYVRKEDAGKQRQGKAGGQTGGKPKANGYSPSMGSASRYSRQYSSPPTGSAHPPPDALDREHMDMTQYELSGDFQTLSMKAGQHAPRHSNRGRRRDRHRNDRVPPPNPNAPNARNQTILGSLGDKGGKAKDAKHKEQGAGGAGSAASKTSVVVKSKPAPTNWAQAQKAKPKAKQKAKVNASGFLTGFTPRAAKKAATATRGPPPQGALDSSQRPVDAERVSHVLEVLNMTAGDHQSVSMLFRSYDMEFQTLMSVKRRWFVCMDDERRAMHALNVVKHTRFQLRRIDCNARDVQMLKNNVPPAMRAAVKQPQTQPPPQQQQQYVRRQQY